MYFTDKITFKIKRWMNLNIEVLIVLQPCCRHVRSVSTRHNTHETLNKILSVDFWWIIFIKCFLPLESNKFLASNLIFCRFKTYCYVILNCTTEKQNFVSLCFAAVLWVHLRSWISLALFWGKWDRATVLRDWLAFPLHTILNNSSTTSSTVA